MEDACMNAIIGTLLIVESFVEADDLQDAFEQRRLGPVVHMRSVETARAMLQETGRKPQIIVVGAAADAVLVRALIEEQNALKVRLLILNDDMGDELTPGVIHLSRPYGERELSSAIDQLVG
ncbi:hypothetical protein [Marinibacterium profundimaris]|nr:hypothetical protein [Marinibacterium profundimaris]